MIVYVVVYLQFGIAYKYFFLVLTYRGLLSHDTQPVKVFSDLHQTGKNAGLIDLGGQTLDGYSLS